MGVKFSCLHRVPILFVHTDPMDSDATHVADSDVTGQRLAVVLNVVDIQCALPRELMPGCQLSRATPAEIQQIDHAEASMLEFPDSARVRHRCAPVFTDTPQGRQTEYIDQPMERWRYFVIRFEGNQYPMTTLEQVTHVSRAPLDFPLTLFHGGGRAWNYTTKAFEGYPADDIPVYGDAEIDDLVATRKRIDSIKADHPDIVRAIRMYHSLRFLPSRSEFHVMGLFAIIELLLTHQPGNKEIGDSIQRQLRTKIPLITRRTADKVNYSGYFEPAPEEVLWARLYDVRSALAHGGEPSFTGSSQMLKHLPAVQAFLRHATWVLIRQALNEPELVRDLKRC